MEAHIAAAIAANRFGLGARPGELERIEPDPRGWLLDQLEGPPPVVADDTLPSTAEILGDAIEARGGVRQADGGRPSAASARRASAARDGAAARRLADILRDHRSIYAAEVDARTRNAVETERPFVERLTHFWTNHFAVSVDKATVLGIAGAFEREAIRPHVLGRFVDLLLAAERHPAMLIYLDNVVSIGPGSPAARLVSARRGRELGLNENLAREILELHTLGVDGPYTQEDVTRFAEVLTGWSIGGANRLPARLAQRLGASEGQPGEFLFRAALHEPGAKRVVGKRYPDDGEGQGEAVLRDLAAHPSTARFVATKLARHFIADDPPDAAVERIARTFLETDGDLPSVYRALIDAPEAWQAPLAKYKTPSDYVLSAFRGLDVPASGGRLEAASFELLGQRTYAPGSPAGWPDRSGDWDGASALLKRIEWADALAARIGSRRRATALAPSLLGGTLTAQTRTAIERAATAEQALTLLLVAPEFMRR
ncbi:MAG TPA: DUF1800 domain-containing protein [Gammaproteobacteria bacterium]